MRLILSGVLDEEFIEGTLFRFMHLDEHKPFSVEVTLDLPLHTILLKERKGKSIFVVCGFHIDILYSFPFEIVDAAIRFFV
jgi:hypothetical protein